MTVIEGVDHFFDIFRILAELLIEILLNSVHVQIVVLHDVHFLEDALGKTGARDGTCGRQIHQGLLLGTWHLEARLLGAAINDVAVAIGMLAAVVHMILIHGIRFIAINLTCSGVL